MSDESNEESIADMEEDGINDVVVEYERMRVEIESERREHKVSGTLAITR